MIVNEYNSLLNNASQFISENREVEIDAEASMKSTLSNYLKNRKK